MPQLAKPSLQAVIIKKRETSPGPTSLPAPLTRRRARSLFSVRFSAWLSALFLSLLLRLSLSQAPVSSSLLVLALRGCLLSPWECRHGNNIFPRRRLSNSVRPGATSLAQRGEAPFAGAKSAESRRNRGLTKKCTQLRSGTWYRKKAKRDTTVRGFRFEVKRETRRGG